MQDLPAGSMLAVPKAAAAITEYLEGGLSLAALNGPEFSVVAGPDADIDALEALMTADDVAVRRLHTSHAFHSSMMDPMLAPFAEVVAALRSDFLTQGPRVPAFEAAVCKAVGSAHGVAVKNWTSPQRWGRTSA